MSQVLPLSLDPARHTFAPSSIVKDASFRRVVVTPLKTKALLNGRNTNDGEGTPARAAVGLRSKERIPEEINLNKNRVTDNPQMRLVRATIELLLVMTVVCERCVRCVAA